jgi:RING finger family protein
MEHLGTLAVILVTSAIFLLVVVLSREARRKERRRHDFVERLVDRLGGFLTSEDGWPAVRFQARGYTAVLVCDHGTSDNPACTRVSVNVMGISRGALKIFRDQVPAVFKKLFRMQDIVVGNADFDREFVVQATPESLAWRVFSKERRARAIAATRQAARLGVSQIDLSAERLEVAVHAEFVEFGLYLTLLDAVDQWLEILQEIAPSAEIHWLGVQPGRGALCRVCGTALAGEVVQCRSCRTPHHDDCWTYAGRCSTYACGERRSVRA